MLFSFLYSTFVPETVIIIYFRCMTDLLFNKKQILKQELVQWCLIRGGATPK